MNFDYKKVVFKKSKNKKIEFEFSLKKMKKNLSSFEPTNIDEGLLKTIKWFETKYVFRIRGLIRIKIICIAPGTLFKKTAPTV